MSVPSSREEAREQVRILVRDFRRNAAEYTKAGTAYNETQARTDFITPLIEAFGWDVHNQKRLPLDLREVFEEATVEVGEERLSKKSRITRFDWPGSGNCLSRQRSRVSG